MTDFNIKSFVNDGKYVVGCYLPTLTPVRFKRTWGTHEFTDDEVGKLLAGEQIRFRAFNSKKIPYIASGSLKEQEYCGNNYWGFECDMSSVPAIWQGHVFTDEEIETLNNGGSIELYDCVSKKDGRKFSCILRFGTKDGKKKLVPDFSRKLSPGM